MSERMRLKAMISILGIVLLVILFLAGLLFAILGREPEHVPVVRELANVWVMEVEELGIRVFEDGQECTYGFAEGVWVSSGCREQVADVTLVDELVSQVVCKTNKINGKVLSVDAGGVELQGYGYVAFSEDRKGYRLYDRLVMCEPKDIVIGYDFADFVVENGEICGILLAKEAVMEYIRVLIKSGDYQALFHESLEVTCDADFVVEYGDYGERVQKLYRAGDVCVIDGDNPMLLGDRVCITPSVLTGKLILQNVGRNQGVPAYRGMLEVFATQDGLGVINEVLLEEYLYSVVPSEMPASYPKEALKAQAICARTYAYRYMLHAGLSRYGAHVDDSTGYQVYNNIAEQEAATTAVKETYGQILMVEESGMPAETYYYSTSCGIGSDGDVWKEEPGESPDYLYPYPISKTVVAELQGDRGASRNLAVTLMEEEDFATFIREKRENDYEAKESWYRWSYTVSRLDSERILKRMAERYEVNPNRVLTENSKGEFVSKKIEVEETVKNISILLRGTGGVASKLLIETDDSVYQVLTDYNIRYVLCDTTSQVIRQDGSKVNAPTLLPSAYFVLEPIKEKDLITGYVLHGGGYGHGVGMSQNGARNMALEGLTAKDILMFFYSGCQVSGIYVG